MSDKHEQPEPPLETLLHAKHACVLVDGAMQTWEEVFENKLPTHERIQKLVCRIKTLEDRVNALFHAKRKRETSADHKRTKRRIDDHLTNGATTNTETGPGICGEKHNAQGE